MLFQHRRSISLLQSLMELNSVLEFRTVQACGLHRVETRTYRHRLAWICGKCTLENRAKMQGTALTALEPLVFPRISTGIGLALTAIVDGMLGQPVTTRTDWVYMRRYMLECIPHSISYYY